MIFYLKSVRFIQYKSNIQSVEDRTNGPVAVSTRRECCIVICFHDYFSVIGDICKVFLNCNTLVYKTGSAIKKRTARAENQPRT